MGSHGFKAVLHLAQYCCIQLNGSYGKLLCRHTLTMLLPLRAALLQLETLVPFVVLIHFKAALQLTLCFAAMAGFGRDRLVASNDLVLKVRCSR